jgi:hypothetical protein
MGPEGWEVPTKAELEREAWEEELIRTYEERFTAFCWAHHLDPESVESVLVFERMWDNE